MTYTHNNDLEYEIPNKWCAEYGEDILLIYNPNGEGAITISFFNLLESKEGMNKRIRIMAQSFIEQNQITLNKPLELHKTKGEKVILSGTGTTYDNWFFKLWIVAKYPKVVVASYQSERKTLEVKKCDMIIDSMRFTNKRQGTAL